MAENQEELKKGEGKIFKRFFDKNQPELGEFAWKLWVPESATQDLIKEAHSSDTSCYGGIGKTLHALRRMHYWPQMVCQVLEYIKNCDTCKETKPSNQRLMLTIGAEVVTYSPFQKLCLDFLGKYPRSHGGNAYIFIVVDHFTKFVFLKAMKEATAKGVVNFLVHEVCHKFGVPEILHIGNGKQLVSKEFLKMVQTYGIKHIKTAFYSPQSNASERVNQTVLTALRTYLEKDHPEWDWHLTEIECSLRNSVHTATGVTPYFALFGQNMFTNVYA